MVRGSSRPWAWKAARACTLRARTQTARPAWTLRWASGGPPRAVREEMHVYRISVIGTGYVGLVTGACLADFGNEVTCVDKIPEKNEMLKRMEIPFSEPGLKELVQRNAVEGRLTFTTDLAGAVAREPGWANACLCVGGARG